MAPVPGRGQARDQGRVSRYLRGVWRRKVAILLAVLVAVGFTMVISSSRPTVYRATAEVLVQSAGVELALDPEARPRTDPGRLVQTEVRILRSPAVQDEVRAALGEAPVIEADPAGESDVIAISAEHGTPDRAAAIANAYAEAYVSVRRQQAQTALGAAADQLRDRAQDLQAQIEVSEGPARDALVQQQATLRQQLDRLEVLQAVETGSAEVVTSAQVPASPVAPKPGRAGLAAGAIGLSVAIGIAMVLERFDDSIRTKDQLRRVADLPVIGTIPVVGGLGGASRPSVVSLTAPRSPATEAYRTLRTAVQFLPLEPPTTLQVTSPTAGDGKTTTVANLGVALARAGQHVVLVCCDLRRPKLHEYFGMTNDVGFTSVLLGKVPMSAALQQAAEQERLYVLASGPLPPNPSELLSSRRAREVLNSLRAEAETVIVDSPPVLPVSDAMIVSSLADATLLVCTAERTAASDVERAVEQLRQVEAPLLGAILNGAGPESAFAGKYGYDTVPPTRLPEPAEGDKAGKPKAQAGAKSPEGKRPEGRPPGRGGKKVPSAS